MRVFLTGATGFIGSCVLRRLVAQGHSVAVLMRSNKTAWRIQDILPAATLIKGDLSAPGLFEAALADFKPEAVVDLAWEGVTNTYRNETVQLQNISHTVALLETSIRCGARHFVGLGSQGEYGPSSGVITEAVLPAPTTLYGAAKLSVRYLAETICRRSDIRFAWLRLFSSYGPRDDPSWLIPSTILALLGGARPALTKGEQQWDFVYADDAAAAICAVAAAPSAAGVFNLGSGEIASIRSVVERIRDLVSPGAPLGFGELDYRPDQVMHLQADISRLISEVGWKPQVSLDEGLRQTVSWFREERDRYKTAG